MPSPLAWLLVAVALLGLTWAFLVPAWQAPDENSHFAYVQALGEQFELPGDGDRPIYSTEQALAIDALNADQVAGVPDTKPEWSAQAYDRWLDREATLPDRLRAGGGGPNPAGSNPPLYYLYESVAYRAAGGDIFERILAMRIFGLLWPLLTTVGAWLLAGELFGRDRALQLAAAGLAGLVPMMSFISASINPDGMLYALWTLFLWLGVRALRRGLDVPTALALAGVTGVALVVKGTSYALLPALVFVIAVGLWRGRREGIARTAAVVGSAVFALAATAGVWALVARSLDRTASGQLVGTEAGAAFNIKQFLGYVWQFYLPKLPFQEPWPTATGLPLYDVFLKGTWGSFGWLEVPMAEVVYAALAAITLLAFAGAGFALWRSRRSLDLSIAVFLVLVVAALLAGLHWTEYHYVLDGNVNFMQGRYLFPLIGLAGAVLAKALTLVPETRRAHVVAAVVGVLVGLQLYGLGLVLERYYG